MLHVSENKARATAIWYPIIFIVMHIPMNKLGSSVIRILEKRVMSIIHFFICKLLGRCCGYPFSSKITSCSIRTTYAEKTVAGKVSWVSHWYTKEPASTIHKQQTWSSRRGVCDFQERGRNQSSAKSERHTMEVQRCQPKKRFSLPGWNSFQFLVLYPNIFYVFN